jgi:glutamate synthase domain-containing protein 2
MFSIIAILVSALLSALAGWSLGGIPAALFMGAIGTLLAVAVRDISKHRHAILAGTLLAGVAGTWIGGLTLGVPLGLLGFLILLAVHDFLLKKDAVLPIGLSIMLVIGAIAFGAIDGTTAARGAIATVASIIGFLLWVGTYDYYLQSKHTIRRNFPILGWCRYGFELIGDELRQYWFMGNLDEWPYNRKTRRYLYQSGKGINNNLGFGTEEPYRQVGKLHLLQEGVAIRDRDMGTTLPRLVVGSKRRKPWIPSHPIGIAHMSFGALSEEAVRALSSGGKLADIHMGTGEGGLTKYHIEGVVKPVPFKTKLRYYRSLAFWNTLGFRRGVRPEAPKGEVVGGTKIIVEIGPAKFGFRRLLTDPFTSSKDRGFRKVWSNEFDFDKFVEVMQNDQFVAFEVKGGQGAKPGQGGKLPKEKITPEIAEIRGVAMGEDCYSPNAWDEWDTPEGLIEFGEKLAAGCGKPWGYKTPLGMDKFMKGIAQVMKETGKGPDFITIDGGEGGTGAAPVVLADSVGLPLFHAIPKVDNILREAGVRDNVVLIGSGQIAKGDDIVIAMALGCDMVHIARAFLIGGLGCIMALRCHTNRCPTGIATQDPRLRRGLDPLDKYQRVYNYASVLQREILMICKAMGVRTPWDLTRDHISVVVSPLVSKTVSEIIPYPDGDNGKRAHTLAPALAATETPHIHDDRGPRLIKLERRPSRDSH